MILRVKLVGSGKDGDPYRVNLPTYGHVHGNIAERVALVSVAPDVLGLTDDDLKGEEAIETTEGPYYPKLSQALIDKAHSHFDDAYPGKDHQLDLAEA
jgi:hypothetical protein